MWSTVTSIPLAVPQSLAYLSNQASYDGTKWLHWMIFRVFWGRLIRMVGPPPSAAARATPVVVVTNSRRSMLLRLVMDLPPCVLLHRPFMAGQSRFVAPSPQAVTAARRVRRRAGFLRRATSETRPTEGAPGAAPPRSRRGRVRARPAARAAAASRTD